MVKRTAKMREPAQAGSGPLHAISQARERLSQARVARGETRRAVWSLQQEVEALKQRQRFDVIEAGRTGRDVPDQRELLATLAEHERRLADLKALEEGRDRGVIDAENTLTEALRDGYGWRVAELEREAARLRAVRDDIAAMQAQLDQDAAELERSWDEVIRAKAGPAAVAGNTLGPDYQPRWRP